eukprot:95305-Karenia_brevis.AAC.1
MQALPATPISGYSQMVMWQCGLLGMRVGEAKNPGPLPFIMPMLMAALVIAVQRLLLRDVSEYHTPKTQQFTAACSKKKCLAVMAVRFVRGGSWWSAIRALK